MKVLLNGLQAGNRSGTGRYTTELARWLPQVSNDLDLAVVWPKNADPPNTEAPGFTLIKKDFPSAGRRLFYDQLGLRSEARQARADLTHYPANVGNLFGGIRSIVTVHDLSFIRHPSWYTLGRSAYYRSVVSRSTRTAARIIADSTATADDLINLLGVSALRIDVIPLGVSEAYTPQSAAQQKAVREKYSLPEAFFLFVGTLEPRKNVIRIIQGWAGRAQAAKLPLVIAGRDGWKVGPIHQAANQYNDTGKIHFPGFIAEEDLPALLSAAKMLVWPSLWEGFGLLPLESMACGTPVVTSNSSSLPEVVGDAALTVDPYDADAIGEAMLRLASDEKLYKNLRERGLSRAKEFTWKRTAELTCDAYRRAMIP
jgi:glycosyltransferase involved in cell wall biosynthesis